MTRKGSPPVWTSMAVMRIQSLGGFHWRMGARLNFIFDFAATV
jgi:hypothetical protein